MITLKLTGADRAYRSLFRIERNVERTTDEFLKFAAEWLQSDIKSHWSSRSPSAEGQAPARVTGNLDSSVKVGRQGRGDGGKFGSKGASKFWYVTVDTAEGDNPNGRGSYAQLLESKLNRPFMQPALDRLERIYPTLAKRYIKP